jgi:hypothetical protein
VSAFASSGLEFSGTGLLGVEFDFVSATQLEVAAEGGTPIELVWNAADGAYVTEVIDGETGLVVSRTLIFVTEDPERPGYFLFRLEEFDESVLTSVGHYFTGDFTVGQDFTGAGTVTYRGDVLVTDEALSEAGGDITLVADFDSTSVSGNLSIDAGTSLGAADFTMAETAILGGEGTLFFENGLTSSDTNVLSSSLHGAFVGANADYVGGVIRIVTDQGEVAGVYVAE